ncbi:MerR family DNA-binding transcriptional regulator [Amycolatopsis regifaucium]|uniref:HTH merR-type domain-containing protein n=1 Tax=Amycolatopsis regifaucium TaxID=546365 RepID=A0A154M4R5_9PSEU|nr:MerR family DNA-binding transcriptional regulator [Amycolatopsis regifaucium]KZB79493.1 hypothetical protein AVL48_18145 [Amycolatopsis regifaucium]OKA07674.1 hypothetical protein ATP06_0217830 [Amycolatopsis regifaucium]SFH05724.1 MerR family regulatory protein [Amycolatopsis regifaucium]
MKIGELSHPVGVNAHQLCYYEAQGLLKASRGANGYREYDETALLRVDEQLAKLARSRDALAEYIVVAERVGGESHPPFDGAAA